MEGTDSELTSNNTTYDEILKWQDASTQRSLSTADKMTNVVRDGYLSCLY